MINVNDIVPQRTIKTVIQRGFNITKQEEKVVRRLDINEAFLLFTTALATVYTDVEKRNFENNEDKISIILPSVSLDLYISKVRKDIANFKLKHIIEAYYKDRAIKKKEKEGDYDIPFYVNFVAVAGENTKKKQYITLKFNEDLQETKINTDELSWRMYLFLKVLEDYKNKHKVESVPRSLIETYMKELTLDLSYFKDIEIDIDEKEYSGIEDYPTLDEWFSNE